jgi:class 3 adenylate cyclase
MGLIDDLQNEVKTILRESWTTREGQKVPESTAIKLGNEAVKLEGTVLYADLEGSTNLVDEHEPEFAAEIYKSYLHCASKIIQAEGGVITSYDGDRVMSVFIGDSKNTSAVRTALKINYAVKNIINPAIQNQYSNNFQVKQVVGIDTCNLFIARTGVRGSNDLVWVGRAANHAAKLTSLKSDFPTWITSNVYNNLHESVKYAKDGRSLWEGRSWTAMNKILIYRSNWLWKV